VEREYKRIRIFAASTRDVGEERSRLARVVEGMNRTGAVAQRMGFTLELLRWETHVAPDVGDPQKVVFQDLHPEDWDVFVGILWMRFGSPTGSIDPDTGQRYRSGTEEEFKAALRQRDAGSGRPKIMFYRCVRPADPRAIDPDQVRVVQEFFRDFEAGGRHPGLVSEYAAADEFERLVHHHLDQLILNQAEVQHPAARTGEARSVSTPGIGRFLVDRWLPGLHSWLTRVGVLSMPPEWRDLHNYLSTLGSAIGEDIKAKTYVEPSVKDLPRDADRVRARRTGFLTPVQQLIKETVGISHGGDDQTAQISALSRKCKFVRNIVKRLMSANEPLVLLGDPGSGKSLTLQQAAMLIAERASRRVFPDVCVYVRLQEFQAPGEIDAAAVWDFVLRSTPAEVRPYLNSLDDLGRLVIFFDGMDEMNRDRYNEYTAALSVFAGSRRGVTRTLFSCRITDFTPRFQHNRLVLLPFDRGRIYAYLKRQILVFPITLGGKSWTARRLANRLSQQDLPIQADNPFVLWLLCNYLQDEQDWPASRVDLLAYYNRSNYERKRKEASRLGEAFPPQDEVFLALGRIAYEITNRNKGGAIPLESLTGLLTPQELTAVEAGLHCGVLQKSLDLETTLIRFEHHRFQEYFTAYHLWQKPEIRSTLHWLDKLDAPRWQETLLNLVLMRGGQEALAALDGAISDGMREFTERERRSHLVGIERLLADRVDTAHQRTSDAAENERMLADRVELAARVLQQASHESQALAPTFLDCATALADHGNPITQVKMLLASRLVPGLDVFRIAKAPLASGISWVRQQALIVASAVPGAAAGGALQEDVCLNFASGKILNRLGAYIRIASTLKQKRFWFTLALAMSFCATQLLCALGLVVITGNRLVPALSGVQAVFDAPRRITNAHDLRLAKTPQDVEKARLEAQSGDKQSVEMQQAYQAARIAFGDRWFRMIAAVAILLAWLYALRRSPVSQLLAIELSGYSCLALAVSLPLLWLGNWTVAVDGSVGLACLTFAVVPLLWAVTLTVQASASLLFASIAFAQGPRTRIARIMLETIWHGGGLESRLKATGLWMLGGVLVSAVIYSGTLLIALEPWNFIDGYIGWFHRLPVVVKGWLWLTVCVQTLGRSVAYTLRRKRRIADAVRQVTLTYLYFCVMGFLVWAGGFVDWALVGRELLATATLFRPLPPVVNVVFSLVVYAEIVGCLVLTLRARGRDSHGPARCMLWTAAMFLASLATSLVWLVTAINWQALWALAFRVSFLPWLPAWVNVPLSMIVYFETILLAVAGLRLRAGLSSRRFLKRWTLLCLELTALGFLCWFLGAAFLSRVLVIAIVVACSVVIVLAVRQLGREFAFNAPWPRGSRAGVKRSIETWKKDMAGIRPEAQAASLRQTTPESLDVGVTGFLAVLKEIEDLIKKEPAASAYWAKRHEIEQILRQEQSG
jgi:hypothetical protein